MRSDPFRVDHGLREAARAWLSWRRALRRGGGIDHRFERLGAFASRELVLELLAASAADPLAPMLVAWARRLHVEYETRVLVASRERALYEERHALEAPERGRFTLRELRDAALADSKGARQGYLETLASHADHAGDFERRRWAQRVELSKALEGADDGEQPLGSAKAGELAARFLDVTADAMSELGAKDLASVIERSLGRESVASWPARLTPRSLAGLFDEAKWVEHLALELDELPRVHGASSYLRGLAAFGSALGAALAPTKLPFSVANEPFDVRGATFGSLLALAPFGESFARRKLGVARSALGEHRRVLARAVLVGARGLALRVLLRAPALSGRRALEEAYPELVFRAFGVELPARAAAVLFRPRVSDTARFVGLLAAAERATRLERVHDEDWYRNPRAVTELRETTRHAAPVSPSSESLELGSRELEALLGNML